MPEDKSSLQKNVAVYLSQGKLELAQTELQKLLAEAPTDPVALVLAGDVASRSGEGRQAYRFYSQAAEVFQKHGLWDKVLAVQRRLIKLDPAGLDDAAANRIRLLVFVVDAETKLQEGDTAGAVQSYQDAIGAYPNHTLAYQRLASLYLQIGRYAEAMEQYLIVGRAFLSHRLFKKAKPYFERVLELDPNHEEAQTARADILNEEGSPGEAGRYFIVAAEHALQKGQLDRAAGYIGRVKNLGAEEALYLQGILFAKLGRKEDAKQALAQFIRTAKQYSKALTQLGELFEQEGRLDLALKCFERAAQDPGAGKAQKKAQDIGKKLNAVAAVISASSPAVPSSAPPAPPAPLPAVKAVAEPYFPSAEPVESARPPAPEKTVDQDEGPAAALSLMAKPVATEDIGVLNTMGDMCLAEEMFEEAKQVFERLLRAEPGNDTYFEKLNQAREALGLALLKVPASLAAKQAMAREIEMAKEEVSAAPVIARIKPLPPPRPLVPEPLAAAEPQPAPVAAEEEPQSLPSAVLPSRHSTLPKDPLDFLLQLEEAQAQKQAPTGLVQPAPPPAGSAPAPEVKVPAMAAVRKNEPSKVFENKKEIAAVVKRALAGKLKDTDKVKITRTRLDYRVGELPPAFKSQAVLDDEVIE